MIGSIQKKPLCKIFHFRDFHILPTRCVHPREAQCYDRKKKVMCFHLQICKKDEL